MMSPVKNDIVYRAVDCLERILGYCSKVKVCQVFERGADIRSNVVPSRCVVRMSKDTDVGVQLLEGMLCVLYIL